MHEFSLVQSLIEKLEELRTIHNAKKIHSIHILVGRYSGIVIDSFEFAFDVLKKDYESLSGARLFTHLINSNPDEDLLNSLKPPDDNGIPYNYETEIILKSVEME